MDQKSDMPERQAPAADAPEAAVAVNAPEIEERVREILATIYDPEIPVNIYELGLIYDVQVSGDGDVTVTMTLTTPNCPVAGSMPGEVEYAVGTVEAVRNVTVDLVWDPPWTPERMSEAARLELGFI